MNLHFATRRILVGAFVIIVVVSTANFIVQARSYSMLYSALAGLQFTVASVSLRNDTMIGPNLLIHLNVNNPIDYSGLEVSKLNFGTYFATGNSTLFQDDPVFLPFSLSNPLMASSTTLLTVSIRIIQGRADALASFGKTYGQPIIAVTSSLVLVSSAFLERSGNPGEYVITQNVTLT